VEILKNRAAALSTFPVKRLDLLLLYSFDDCTRLQGNILGSTSAEIPQYRSDRQDKQGPVVAVAAEESHIDSA